MRAVLAACPVEQLAAASRAITTRISEWPSFERARAVMLFAALPGEIDLRHLAELALSLGKTVALPRADWTASRLEPAPIRSWDDLVPMGRRILEPAASTPALDVGDLDLVFTPGLAFDTGGRRLGRGGGFYDRFLADPRLRAVTCGVCLDAQIVPAVPADSWDVPMKAIVTESRLIGDTAA